MTKFVLRETLHQYYFIKANSDEEAINMLYEGGIDPVDAEYSDDVIVKEIKDENF